MGSSRSGIATYSLAFQPLQSYEQFIASDANDHPGVYVWGFRLRDTDGGLLPFRPYYVGKHQTSVRRRLEEHHDGICRGTHLLFDKDYLSGSVGRSMELHDAHRQQIHIVYTCKVRRNGRMVTLPKSKLPREDQDRLLPHIQFYTSHLHATFVPVAVELFPDPAMRNELVEYLERIVKHDLIGRRHVLGRIPLPGVRKFDLGFTAPGELSHIFQGEHTFSTLGFEENEAEEFRESSRLQPVDLTRRAEE